MKTAELFDLSVFPLVSGVCVEAEALQMKYALTPTQMNTLKYLLRSTIRLLHKAYRAHRLHTFPYESAQCSGWGAVHVCVGGKVARSQTTCGPQARFVPALLGEARQTPPQWCACASVTPGLCMGAPASLYRPLMMKRTRPSVCRGPFLSGHK